MAKATKVQRMLFWMIALAIVFVALIAFVYSPYYAKSGLWLLDRFVSEKVDPVAAESQKNGQLSAENELEPGSKEWVARQAYLAEVNHSLDQNDASKFLQLQQRYNLLLKMIEEQKQDELNHQLQVFANNAPQENLDQEQEDQETENSTAEVEQEARSLLTPPSSDSTVSNSSATSSNSTASSNSPTSQTTQSTSANAQATRQDLDADTLYSEMMSDENQPLFAQYRAFLTDDQSKIQLEDSQAESENTSHTPFIFQRPTHQPHAIVILGGGLTSGEKKGEIVVNAYTKKRLEQAVEIYQTHHLPIVLSGVEAPYMQKWLEQHQIHAQFLENRSMNTCENTRFSSLLLQKQGGAPTVFLVTDAYHMARAKRLFAINGIATIPVTAPLPNPMTDWQPSKQNLMHSRRVTYEILATLRDVWFGESNCREIP